MTARLAGLRHVDQELARARRRVLRSGPAGPRRGEEERPRSNGEPSPTRTRRQAGTHTEPRWRRAQITRSGGRALRAEDAARGLQRSAARRSDDRLLVQPLQRRRGQGRDALYLTEYERDAIRPHVSASSAICSRRPRRARRCCSISTTGRAPIRTRPHRREADARRGSSRGPFGAGRRQPLMPPPARARRAAEPEPAEARPQRELRPRADGAAHARRGRRLHAEGRRSRWRARFTGWTIVEPRQGGGFRFEPRMHDPGEKIVLGHMIKAGGGESDGEQVLDILARHPVDRALHRDEAGAPVRRRHAAAGARRSRRGAVPRDRRRPPRGDANDPDVARVLLRPTPIARR